MANGAATAKTKARAERAKAFMNAVYRDSVQRVLDVAQTPTAAGGNMRVDTGFLRASLVVFVGNGLPSQSLKPNGDQMFSYNTSLPNLVLAGAKVSDTVTAVWTANYARPREYRDGFVRLAAQQWPRIVEQSAKAAKARMK